MWELNSLSALGLRNLKSSRSALELDAHGKLLFRLNLTSITSWEVAQLNEVVGVSMSWYVVEQAQYTEEVSNPAYN